MRNEFSRPLQAAADQGQFPFLGEGVAVGRGRVTRRGRQAAANHNEKKFLFVVTFSGFRATERKRENGCRDMRCLKYYPHEKGTIAMGDDVNVRARRLLSGGRTTRLRPGAAAVF